MNHYNHMSFQLLSSIDSLILDMDGVLWRTNQPIGDLKSIFKLIKQIGWKVTFATNNATRTTQQYLELLSSFGVQAESWQIITSAVAVIYHLKILLPHGGPVFIIGEHGLIEACAEQGYHHSMEDPLAVIASMDRSFTYEKMQKANQLIRSGVPFIGTNPDHTFPTPQGLVPGAGSILAAIATASDVQPIIAGKPEPTMYRIALERLKTQAERVLVVGDRPETDIAGAQFLGCHTALVLSGVTNAAQAKAWRPVPDLIIDSLESIVKLHMAGK
jgi:HAD superfamily hydrolase (TIGR01450 family)